MIITAGFLRKDTVEVRQHVDVQVQASRQHPAKRMKKTDGKQTCARNDPDGVKCRQKTRINSISRVMWGYFRRRWAEFAGAEHRSAHDRFASRLELERHLANLLCVFVSVALRRALLVFKTIMTETPPETQQQPYTFVRIKRKRTDAPLDALGACLMSSWWFQEAHTS